MKNILQIGTLFLFVFIANIGLSQSHNHYYTYHEKDRLIEVENQYYKLNYRGIKKLLNDSDLDIDLKNNLDNQLRIFKRRYITGHVFLWSGLVAGGAIIYNGSKEYRNMSDESFSPSDVDMTNVTQSVFLGMGVFIVGGIAYALIAPSEDDYLDLVNRFNKENESNNINIVSSFDRNKDIRIGITISI